MKAMEKPRDHSMSFVAIVFGRRRNLTARSRLKGRYLTKNCFEQALMYWVNVRLDRWLSLSVWRRWLLLLKELVMGSSARYDHEIISTCIGAPYDNDR